MKVLDLLSGMKGWGQPWEEAGHEVIYLDIRPDLNPTIVADIMEVEPTDIIPWQPDVILASPPCKKFSIARINRNWTEDNQPRTPEVQAALDLVYRTRYWIETLNPKFFVIENPRGKLRKLDVLADLDLRTVTYCQYGEDRMKPTDLWGGFPPSLILRPMCKNGDTCHVSAPRGSETGTQGRPWEEVTKVPAELSNAVRIAAEKDFWEK
jgi:C-5 cytosine-specific DNA methylase